MQKVCGEEICINLQDTVLKFIVPDRRRREGSSRECRAGRLLIVTFAKNKQEFDRGVWELMKSLKLLYLLFRRLQILLRD